MLSCSVSGITCSLKRLVSTSMPPMTMVCLPRLLWRCLPNHASSTATTPESSSPPSDGRCWRKRAYGSIAESCCQTNTARTLGGLAKPWEDKRAAANVAYCRGTMFSLSDESSCGRLGTSHSLVHISKQCAGRTHDVFVLSPARTRAACTELRSEYLLH